MSWYHWDITRIQNPKRLTWQITGYFERDKLLTEILNVQDLSRWLPQTYYLGCHATRYNQRGLTRASNHEVRMQWRETLWSQEIRLHQIKIFRHILRRSIRHPALCPVAGSWNCKSWEAILRLAREEANVQTTFSLWPRPFSATILWKGYAEYSHKETSKIKSWRRPSASPSAVARELESVHMVRERLKPERQQQDWWGTEQSASRSRGLDHKNGRAYGIAQLG